MPSLIELTSFSRIWKYGIWPLKGLNSPKRDLKIHPIFETSFKNLISAMVENKFVMRKHCSFSIEQLEHSFEYAENYLIICNYQWPEQHKQLLNNGLTVL